MNKCNCYLDDRYLVDYTPFMKPIYKTVAVCNGTKERDICSCGGDKTKCDFYPEVKEKALKEKGADSEFANTLSRIQRYKDELDALKELRASLDKIICNKEKEKDEFDSNQ